MAVDLPSSTDTKAQGAAKIIAALQGIGKDLNDVITVLQQTPDPVPDPNTAPKAVIKLVSQKDLAVSLSAEDSTDAEGALAAFGWTFGDGESATGVFASHTYKAAGKYTVRLAVRDQGGLSTVTETQLEVTVTAAPVTPPTGTEPTGAGIVSYRTLAGANPTAKLASVTSGQKVSLPPQVIAWNDFAQAVQSGLQSTSGYGLLIQKVSQLLGSGIGNTVLRMNAGTTTKKTQVGGTTKLEYIGVTGPMKLIQDLTVQGTPINEGSYTGAAGKQTTTADPTTQNLYNGFFLNSLTDFTMRRVKISAIPGSYQAPPGETFGIDVYRGSNHTYEDIEIDGQNTVATGWGPNFLGGAQVVNRLKAHDCRYSSGAAIYACTGTLTMTDCEFRRNYNGVNFEDCAYDSVKLVRPVFEASKTSDINWWADTTTQSISKSFRLDIYDPVVVGGGKIRVRHTTTHGGYPNVMKRSDIHVWVKGVEQPQANVIQFV
jgi:PKD repeat protein